jgi:hypothetical protein
MGKWFTEKSGEAFLTGVVQVLLAPEKNYFVLQQSLPYGIECIAVQVG